MEDMLMVALISSIFGLLGIILGTYLNHFLMAKFEKDKIKQTWVYNLKIEQFTAYQKYYFKLHFILDKIEKGDKSVGTVNELCEVLDKINSLLPTMNVLVKSDKSIGENEGSYVLYQVFDRLRKNITSGKIKLNEIQEIKNAVKSLHQRLGLWVAQELDLEVSK